MKNLQIFFILSKTMFDILKLFLFGLVATFALAKLEIHIEGKHGWARKLPTWRVKNEFTRFLYGKTPFTGYHMWLNIFLIIVSQFPFVIGVPWSISLELKILAMLLLGAVMEDFWWIVLNPSYGLKKFTKKHIHWHRWVGPLPAMYSTLLFISILLLNISLFV